MGTVQNNNTNHSAFIKWAGLLLLFFITAFFAGNAFAVDPVAQKAVDLCTSDLSSIVPGPDQSACEGSYVFSKIICLLQNRITLISCYMFNYFASKLGGILALIIVIYVAMFGAFVILGLTKITAGEAVSRLLKIAIIWILATNLNIGFKLMHNFFNGIMQAGVSIATTTPSLQANQRDLQCLEGGNSPDSFGSFVNFECVFRSMFGLDGSTAAKREYLELKKHWEDVFDSCVESGTSPEGCVTAGGSTPKEDYMFLCQNTIGYSLARQRRCTIFDRMAGTSCLTEEDEAAQEAKCEEHWAICDVPNPSEGCKQGILNYKRNFIYHVTFTEADRASMTNPATISSFILGSLAFFAIPAVGPIIAMFLLSIALLMFYMFIRAILGYMLVVITIALLVSTAIVFLSFAFFESTQDYFQKWYQEIGKQVIQPFILFAALIMFSHYVLDKVAYFQRIIDTGVMMSESTSPTVTENSLLFYFLPTLDYENIPRQGVEPPYSRPSDYPYSKEYIELHNPNLYAHCGDVAFGAEPRISELPDETKIRCYNKHKDEDINYVIGSGILSRQLPQNNPIDPDTGKKTYNMNGLSPDYLSCLRNAAKNCPLRALRAEQRKQFAQDIFFLIIAATLLSFAMINFIENIGTLVNITALQLSSLGPNIAPIGRADMAKGGRRARQYAYFGAVEGAGLATRKWMVRAGATQGFKAQRKVASSFWNVGKDTVKGVGKGAVSAGKGFAKGVSYANRTSPSDAARDARNTASRGATAAAGAAAGAVARGRAAIADKTTPKPSRANKMDFSDLKKLSPKELVKSMHEDGIRATGAKIRDTVNTVVSDNIDKEELKAEQNSAIYKMVDGISNKTIDMASDAMGTDNQHTGEFGSYLAGARKKGPQITREDIEATSTGPESG